MLGQPAIHKHLWVVLGFYFSFGGESWPDWRLEGHSGDSYRRLNSDGQEIMDFFVIHLANPNSRWIHSNVSALYFFMLLTSHVRTRYDISKKVMNSSYLIRIE